MSWEGLNYQPIAWIRQRIQARSARTERRNFLRFLEGRPNLIDLTERLRRIRKDPALGREEKQEKFAQLLNDYAAKITEAQAIAAGAAGQEGGEVVGNPSAEKTVIA